MPHVLELHQGWALRESKGAWARPAQVGVLTFQAARAGRGRSRQGKEQAGKGAGRLRSHAAPPPLGKGRASLESLTQLYHHQRHNSPLMIITGFPAALLFRGAGAFLVAIGAV